jgi:hypothetical protein
MVSLLSRRPGYLYAAVQREAVQEGVSMLDNEKVQEIMGRHLDAAGAFWRALEFTPDSRRSLFSTLWWEGSRSPSQSESDEESSV